MINLSVALDAYADSNLEKVNEDMQLLNSASG